MMFRLFLMYVFLTASAIGDGWEYHTEIRKVNTYIEGKTGILSYNGIFVPSQVRTIQTPKGCFSFVSSPYEWGTKGWIRCKDYVVQESDAVFNYLYSKNWYSGKHLADTPKHWCWLVEYDIWIDPLKLKDYADSVLKTPERYANTITGIHEETNALNRFRLERILDDAVFQEPHSWYYYIHYEVNGSSSRSGRRGILVYGKKTLGFIPGVIVCSSGAFKYYSGKFRTDDRGWFAVFYEPEESKSEIDSDTLKKGMYTGAKMKNTPERWIYLSSYDIWVDPDTIKIEKEVLESL